MLISKAVEGYILDISTSYALGTIKLNGLYLSKLVEYLGDPELDKITPADLSRYMVFMRKDFKPKRFSGDTSPLSPSALDNHWKAIRSFFGWAERNIQAGRPDRNLQRPRFKLPEVPAFTRDELKQIITAAEWYTYKRLGQVTRAKRPKAAYCRALILLLQDTGLRIGEVSRLKVEDINLKTGEILVAPFGSGQKTKPRTVYLGAVARRAIWLYLAKKEYKPVDPLFSIDSTVLRDRIERIGKEAGVSKCNPHRFRHTFAIEFLRAGGDPFVLKRLLGHSTLEMVEHYLDLAKDDLRRNAAASSPADRWKL
jgi:integrase/recombinase XerD